MENSTVANTTENQIDGTIESAVSSIIAPPEEVIEETIEEEAQATEETTEPEVEETAESEEEEIIASEEDSEEDLESEDDEDQVEEAVLEETDIFSVKVDGNNIDVTLEELKQGYSGQKYVQKGMQEAAAQKKEAEEVYANLVNERKQIANLYEQLQSGNFVQPPVEPSRERFEADPLGYMSEKLEYDEAKAGYDRKMSQLKEVSQKNTEAEQQATEAYIKREMEELQRILPEFSDPQKANEIKDKLVLSGKAHYGYSEEEISQVMDHRAIRVLHDAMKYQDIIAGKAKAVTKTRKAKPVLKAGAKKVKDSSNKVRERQKAKLRRSGSVEDALGLILNQ